MELPHFFVELLLGFSPLASLNACEGHCLMLHSDDLQGVESRSSAGCVS